MPRDAGMPPARRDPASSPARVEPEPESHDRFDARGKRVCGQLAPQPHDQRIDRLGFDVGITPCITQHGIAPDRSPASRSRHSTRRNSRMLSASLRPRSSSARAAASSRTDSRIAMTPLRRHSARNRSCSSTNEQGWARHTSQPASNIRARCAGVVPATIAAIVAPPADAASRGNASSIAGSATVSGAMITMASNRSSVATKQPSRHPSTRSTPCVLSRKALSSRAASGFGGKSAGCASIVPRRRHASERGQHSTVIAAPARGASPIRSAKPCTRITAETMLSPSPEPLTWRVRSPR